ncbi:MAG: N-glycosylase/DNA lyase [Planctomycetes bacterium]|nr:N-glycosylase/DNA lyase [Planctomycetota bacterium]
MYPKNCLKLLNLQSIYADIKHEIAVRIIEFDKIWESNTDEELFAEFAFCLLTPQSKARKCWSAVEKLITNNVLIEGSEADIVKHLDGVRFHNKKARNVVEAREKFFIDGKFTIKNIILRFEVSQAREFLVENVKGFGMKEASHFLRNVGKGAEIAILDRHILRNLVNFKVIEELPKSIPKNMYYEIESRMKEFAKRIEIPLNHLDILLWFKEAGEIFK